MVNANAQQVALVTGAARRIGRAIALELASLGWPVALHCHGSRDAAHDTLERIQAIGGTGVVLTADLADASAVAGLIPAAAGALGTVTCLINNAALFEHDTVETLDPAQWDRQHAVNLRAPVFLTQAFARALPPARRGAVINIIDQRVWKPSPDFLSYTVSKSALWTATRTLAQALAPRIRVNAIGPGPALPNPYQDEAALLAEQRATLLRRGPALDEITAAVRFILDTPSLTGQMIALDGGQHLLWQTPDTQLGTRPTPKPSGKAQPQ